MPPYGKAVTKGPVQIHETKIETNHGVFRTLGTNSQKLTINLSKTYAGPSIESYTKVLLKFVISF